MTCCGNKRQGLQYNSKEYLHTDEVTIRSNRAWPDVSFEYTGETGLTVKGGITGKRYRFDHKGQVQLIDYRDVNGMMAIPLLRKMKN